MTPRAQKILEIYRNYPVRTTVSGRRVRWDEPDEEDSLDIRRHNAALERARKKRQDAKERLKSKGAVPTKDGPDF